MTACRLFKEISMHYLCKKLRWMWISKVCTQIKPKVSMPWHWNSVNETIMLLPKDVSNNFTKTIFSLRDIIKIVSNQEPVILRNPLYLCKIFTTW